MIKTPELLEDPELMESVKRIETWAARDGFDLTEFYAMLDAAYAAGCQAGSVKRGSE